MMQVKRYLNRKRELYTSKQTDSRLKVIFQYSAVLLTLLVGVFYYFGYLYLSQRLGFWGVNPEMFPFSKEEIIIAGGEQLTLAFVNTLADSSPLMFGAITLFFLVLILSSVRKLRAMFRNKLLACVRRIRFLRPHIEVTDNHDRAMTFMNYVCLAFLVVIALLIVVASLSDRVIKRAQQDSKKIREGIIVNKPTIPKAVLIVKNDSKGFNNYSGYLIHTSGNHCLLYDNRKRTIVLPLANMVRMEIKNKQN